MINRWHYPILTSIVIIGLSFFLFIKINTYFLNQDIIIEDTIVNQVTPDETSLDLKTIIHETNKSVVQIEAIDNFSTLTGSGFLYNDQGDIITNAHVVKDMDYIYVKTANAHVYPAAIVGIGEELDIAVIRVPELTNYSFLDIEEESMLEIGDEVIALGSPHGFQNTVTTGIISGKERNFSIDGYSYENVYQISALIMEGNSGGPLVSRDTGKVVGINSVGTDDGAIGFSIPMQLVFEQVTQWSKETTNQQLQMPEIDLFAETIDSDQLEENASYIIDYFFESIQMRDYIGAYTLLGSTLQSEMTYPEFRDQFVDLMDLNYEKIQFTDDENTQDKISAIVDLDIERHKPDEELSTKETYTFTFQIGFENEQVKILMNKMEKKD